MKSEQFSTGLCRSWFNPNRDNIDYENQTDETSEENDDEPPEIGDLNEIVNENR